MHFYFLVELSKIYKKKLKEFFCYAVFGYLEFAWQ